MAAEEEKNQRILPMYNKLAARGEARHETGRYPAMD